MTNYLPYYLLFAGLWAAVNGILHTVFVLLQNRSFDRDLIRLLMDGHLLVFAGIFYFLSLKGVKNQDPLAYYIAITSSIFLLTYCALILRCFHLLAP